MNEATTKKQQKFDVAEYAEKVRGALKKLKEKQRPGVSSGVGTKTDVLNAAKADIKAVINEGYTAKQVAEAIGEDVFGILPKSITQLVAAKPAAKRVKKAQSNEATNQATAKTTNAVTNTKTKSLTPAGAPATGAPGTLTVQNDTENL